MSKTLIIDYGAGNLRSVLNSFTAVANADEHIALSSDARELASADRVILPGVGAYAECRKGLNALDGMIEGLNNFALKQGKPFLGVCVGMQLLVQSGNEHGVETDGLGWLSGHVAKIKPQSDDAKIPHMGWNNLTATRPHALFKGIEESSDVYFVHSYAVMDGKPEERIATADYYGEITAMIGRDNIVGTQFHPEKSQTNGLAILRNFLNWRP